MKKKTTITIMITTISLIFGISMNAEKINDGGLYGLLFLIIMFFGFLGGLIIALVLSLNIDFDKSKKHLWNLSDKKCSYCGIKLTFDTSFPSSNFILIQCNECYKKNQKKALLAAIKTLF